MHVVCSTKLDTSQRRMVSSRGEIHQWRRGLVAWGLREIPPKKFSFSQIVFPKNAKFWAKNLLFWGI